MIKASTLLVAAMLASAASAGSTSAAITNNAEQRFAAVVESLQKTNGLLTPTIRALYLEWAEQTVSNQLAAAQTGGLEDCWSEVRSDPTLRDAMFVAVDPPDPSILVNYARLRERLGNSFVKQYRSLVVATAVATRTGSLATHPEPARKKNPVREYFEVLDEDLQPNQSDDDRQLPQAIAEFIKLKNSTAREVYQDQGKQQALVQFLKEQNVEPGLIARIENPKRLGPALMAAMIVLGQRPATREPEPDIATWLQYLASVYQSKPVSTPSMGHGKKTRPMPWPLFPMDKCPWPLLMPLSRALPLGEARYIWETFQGAHGQNRYHLYGPYRGRSQEMLYELEPSPWHWNSWQDRIVHGGVCVVMATISLDTHRALCEPAVHAGQPHHANLIAYHNVGGAWTAIIEQSVVGGPEVTHAGWLFKDGEIAPRLMDKNRCGSEYHLGLAAGMNIGLRPYLDTRIAVHLFNALPDELKKTVGVKLLTQAVRTNPFNPAAWYLLAQQNPVAARNLLSAQAASTGAFNSTSKEAKRHSSHDIGAILERDNAQVAQVQVQRYWQTVGQLLTNPDGGNTWKPRRHSAGK